MPRSERYFTARPRAAATNRGCSSWLSLAWLVGFFLFFYSFTLPNNHVGRFDILFNLPALLPVSELWSPKWSNLGQRADIVGIAALILSGAWGLGQLAMRMVRPPVERPSIEHTFFAMALGSSAIGTLTLVCGLVGFLNRWLFVGRVRRGRRGGMGAPDSGAPSISGRQRRSDNWVFESTRVAIRGGAAGTHSSFGSHWEW